jgi:hypothetical protein
MRTDRRLDHLLLRLRRLVNIRAVALLLFEITFRLQDVHHGHDGGVSDPPFLEQRFVDLPHSGRSKLPHHFHDFEFLAGEGL